MFLECSDGNAQEMSALYPADPPPLLEVENAGGEREWPIPPRKKLGPIVGTRGSRKIVVEVNHLLLSLSNTEVAYHYDCAFKPDKISKKLAR